MKKRQFLTRNKTISHTWFGRINRLCQEIKNMKSNIPQEEQNKAKREGRIQRRIEGKTKTKILCSRFFGDFARFWTQNPTNRLTPSEKQQLSREIWG